MNMRRSQVLFTVCLCFVFGVGLGSFIELHLWWLWLILLWLSFLLSFIKKFFFILTCFLLAGFLGFGRFHLSDQKFTADDLAFYNGQKIEFEGVVIDVDERLDQIKLTVDAKKVFSPTKVNGEEVKNFKNVKGKVLIKSLLFPKYDYGDYVLVNCKIQTPKPIEEFRYDRYLARYGIFSVCYNSQIKIIDKQHGSWLKTKLLRLKYFLMMKINQTLPEPHASFLAGILFGARKGLPPDLVDDFQVTGVSHIVAISGYNISVVTMMIMNLCLALKINRKSAFFVIVMCLIFFVIITGASSAVIRAAIMGIIVLLSKQFGRRSQVNNVLVLTAAVMLAINPRILFDDAGFQLSFLATIGLVYFVPVVKKYFEWLPEKLAIRENFTTTMAAIIFTTPLILFQFGRLSILAPIVNILILSFIPFLMTVGFIQLAVSFLWLPFGKVIGWLTWLILEYIIRVVEFFAKLKFAAINIQIDLFWLVFCYIILFTIIIFNVSRKNEKKVNSVFSLDDRLDVG